MNSIKAIIPFNGIYQVTIRPRDGYPKGNLWDYNHHLYYIMSSAEMSKRHCELYKDGMMIGKSFDYEEANKNRNLFCEFLNRYINGEFKYSKSHHHLSKDKYFHELSAQTQRNIKRVADTLNEIYNP